MQRKYWIKSLDKARLSRRQMLRGTAGVAVGLGGLAIVGCGDDDDDGGGGGGDGETNGSPTASSSDIKRGGELVIAIGEQPDGLSGSLNDSGKFDTFWQQIYNCLVWFDDNMVPTPDAAGLAASWERTDDTTWLFTLKEGITFHDGTPFDADAVVFNVERILNPDTEAPAFAQWDPVFAGAEALGQYEVQFNLKRPDASILGLLSDRGGVMESPAAIELYGNDGIKENPVGTGPFKFQEWIKDDHITLARFDDYKADGDGAYPYLDSIKWQIIPTETVLVEALRAGDVGFADLPIGAVEEFESDENFTVQRKDGLGWLGWFLNCNLPPLDDLRVRQALAYSIDRDRLNELSYNGQSQPAVGPIWAALGDYYSPDLQGQTYDPDRARELLEEAGYAPGEVQIEISATPPAGQAGYGVAGEQPEVVVQQMAREVGIEIEITPVGPDTFDRFWFVEQNLHGYSSGYSLRSDPGDMMFATYHRDGTYNAGHAEGDDPTKGSFDTVSDLIVEANSEYDVATRKELFNEAEQLIIDEVRSLFLETNFRVVAFNKKYDGFTFYGAGKGSYRMMHEV
ncbi:MAG: ABC transporter substrate-binding protein [Dehalococcoidia bacterium]